MHFLTMIRFLCALGPTTIHQYSDLVLTVPKPTQQGYAINVSVTIRNSGELAGQEAVQCYVSVPKVDGLITPRFALRHFEKLTLGKGEAPASPPRPLLEVNRGGQVYEILFEPPPTVEDAKNAPELSRQTDAAASSCCTEVVGENAERCRAL